MSKIEELRAAIADESLSLAVRKEAAQMCVAALLAEVQEPADDDPDVMKLMTSPALIGDELMDHLLLGAWRHKNYLRGWGEDGGTEVQVREHVLSRRRYSLLGKVAKDTAQHDLVRTEAAA